MGELTHRERVELTFNHQTPDRLPLDLMGNASMLLDETYHNLRRYLNLDEIPPIRSGSTANYYDERILEILGVDFRRIFLPKATGNKRKLFPDGSFEDVWGVRYQKIGTFVNAVQFPLAEANTIADIDAYDWPMAEDLYRPGGIGTVAKSKYNTTDYALVARNPLSEGFLDRGSLLMGMEKFFMAMALQPELVTHLVKRMLHIYRGVYEIFLDEVGPWIQMVEAADDLGANDNLLISPDMYRQFIKPAEKSLYTMIHEMAPGAALFHHSDGAIFDIIPDLIEVGVNVLNPVQTSVAGMEPGRLKVNYGDRLVFHGGIEGIEGQVEMDQLAKEIKDRITVLGSKGGYILSSCNHFIDVDPENILHMFNTAHEHGYY